MPDVSRWLVSDEIEGGFRRTGSAAFHCITEHFEKKRDLHDTIDDKTIQCLMVMMPPTLNTLTDHS